MPAFLLAILSIAVFLFLFFGPLRWALATLVGVSFLIPSALTLPYTASAFLTIHRLGLAVFAVGLVRRAFRGEVPQDALRPTLVHVALVAWAGLAFVVGVLYGDRDVPVLVAVDSWLFVFDQFAFFTVVITAVRAIGDIPWVARVVGGIVVLAAGIAVAEHFTGSSYGRWFFANAEAQTPPPGSFPLETRGTQVRVRAAADFALAYAWSAVIMFPLVLAVASSVRRRIAVVLPGVVLLSVVWSYSRSAYAGLGAVLFVVLVGSRFHRRIAAFVVLGGLAALLTLGYQQVVRSTFDAPDTTGSTEVREERLPAVLDIPQARPYLGVGLAGLASRGIESTDASFLLTYAELGAIGLSAFALVIVIALRRVAPALRAPPGVERLVGVAALAGVLAGLIGAFAYDGFHVGSARPFWLLGALGVAVAERVPARAPLAFPRYRLLLPLAGVLAGVWLFGWWTPRAAATFKFTALRTSDVVISQGDIDFVGRLMINSACTSMRIAALSHPDVTFNCYDLRTFAGLGQFRIEARDARTLEAVFFSLSRAGSAVRGFYPYLVRIDHETVPTWVRTAPLGGGAAGLGLALLLPRIRLRRPQLVPAPA